jgi:hypothetical protein
MDFLIPSFDILTASHKLLLNLAEGVCTVVKCSPHHLKVEGSSPDTIASLESKKIAKTCGELFY